MSRSAGPGEDAEKLLAAGRDYRSCDPRLTVRAIKLYMDGALGSRGAALDAPYSDAPGNRGLYVTPPRGDPAHRDRRVCERGIQVETHAIGDRGNRVALDQYEKAFAAVPPPSGPSPIRASGSSMPRSSRTPTSRASRSSA